MRPWSAADQDLHKQLDVAKAGYPNPPNHLPPTCRLNVKHSTIPRQYALSLDVAPSGLVLIAHAT